MEQIKIGTKSEKSLAKLLRNYGYWNYNMPVKVSGQPCDIVAAKEEKILLIDSKHTAKKPSFTFERIEDNQKSAMDYMINFAHLKNVGFAIFFERDEKWYWMPYVQYLSIEATGKGSANISELIPLEDIL